MKKKPKFSFSVHPAGLIVLLLALLFLPSHQVMAAVCALLWHEGCHVAAFLLCGAKECRIELTPFGGMADVKAYEKMPPAHQAVCALSGVIGSGIGSWVVCRYLHSSFGFALFCANFSLALINCLPAWPLDGARVLVSLASAFGFENGMRRLLCTAAVLTGAAMVFASLYGACRGWFNPSLLLAGPYLCYASRMGLASERMRKLWGSHAKLQSEPFLQTTIYASRNQTAETLFPRLLGQCPEKRYGLLLQLNSEGKVHKVWTEEEMLEFVCGKEAFGTLSK